MPNHDSRWCKGTGLGLIATGVGAFRKMWEKRTWELWFFFNPDTRFLRKEERRWLSLLQMNPLHHHVLSLIPCTVSAERCWAQQRCRMWWLSHYYLVGFWVLTVMSMKSIITAFLDVTPCSSVIHRRASENRDSAVGIATGCGLDCRRAGVRMSVGARIFSTSSRPVVSPTQPPIQWVLGALSLGVKRLEREADHSPPTSAEVKNCGGIPPFLHTS
jgi:hypothetical protein